MGNSIIKSYIKVSNVVKLKLFTCYYPEGKKGKTKKKSKQGAKVFFLFCEKWDFSIFTKQNLTQFENVHTQTYTKGVTFNV